MGKEKAKRNVVLLFRLISLISVVSGVAVIVLAAFGIHSIFSRHVIGVAEKEAIMIGQLLTEQQREVLFVKAEEGSTRLEIASSYQDWFDQHVRKLLEPFDILKIKIFAPDTEVLYSTETALIGQRDPSNPRLQRALKGLPDSHLEQKDSLRDLKNESNFNVDVVETYTPIQAEGKIVGAIEIYVDVTQFRSEIYSGTLKSLLLLTSILIFVSLIAFFFARSGMKQLARAEDKLLSQATLDALTGVFNRGELMKRAGQEFSRNCRTTSDGALLGELCLVMLDIDHFKRVNDLYGHQAGDVVLHELAQRIRQALRLYDSVGRYGGEEFLFLRPHTKLTDALNVAERIRQIIQGQPFQINGIELPVTASLGLACAEKGLSLNQTIDQADRALYQAKQNGRNRVEVFSPPRQDQQLDKAL